MKKYIIALDQGTTSSRAILFDKFGNVIKIAQNEFTQIYPQPGWVEHDPEEIWLSTNNALKQVIKEANIDVNEIDSIGITNQRETTIVWDKHTFKPVYNAIVWQCRRTKDICDDLVRYDYGDYIKESTGLIVDPYFSATKIQWILENVPYANQKAHDGDLIFGTVDTFLLYRLTKGKVFATDYTNASRTMLFDINRLEWDDRILAALLIPKSMMPKVLNSSDDFGYTEIDGVKIPIRSMIGDQQAALFGQACFDEANVKNTYGTGGFILMNTKDQKVESKHNLLTTIGVGIDNKIEYALEGSIFNAGSTMQWLRDELDILFDVKDSEYFANKVKDNGDVYLVPAFSGLGAPYWDSSARGSIFGLSRGSNKYHVIRAALESIAYQSYDVIAAMENDANLKISSLKVDGGATANNFLMQFQADISNIEVEKAEIIESSALGAAYLAGLYTGFFKSKEEIKKLHKIKEVFIPKMSETQREQLLHKWHQAVNIAMLWNKK